MALSSAFFKKLILAASLVFQIPVSSAQSPSDYDAFDSKYSDLKDPGAKIALIDSAVVDHFKNRKFSIDDVMRMAALRETECRASADLCLPKLEKESWLQLSCNKNGISGQLQESLWRGLIPALKTEATIERFLSELDKCSQVKNGFMLSLGVQAVSASFGAGSKSREHAVNWLKKAELNPTLSPRQKMDAISSAVTMLDSYRVNHLYGKSALILNALQNIKTNDVKLLLIDGNEGKQVLANLVSIANRNFVFTGNYGALVKFLEDFPLLWGFIVDPYERLWIVENHCVEWIQTGFPQKCDKLIAQYSKSAGEKMEIETRLKVIQARNAYLTGASDQAIRLVKETLEIAKQTGDQAFQSWSYFGLSQYYNAETQKSEVEKNLELFKSGVTSMNVGWMKVLPLTRRASMSLDQGRWDGCLKLVHESRLELEKYVAGQMSEHAWMNFFEVLCRAGKRDIPGATKALSNLNWQVRLMPSLGFQKDLAEAAIAAAEKKDHKTLIKNVHKKIGNKHPEIVRTERVISRLVP